MSRRLSGPLTLALGLALLLAQPLAIHRSASPSSSATTSQRTASSAAHYGDLPLAFEPNEGQDSDPAVRFLAHGGGYALALTPSQALLALTPRSATAGRAKPTTLAPITPSPDAASTRLGMRWLGANSQPVVTGEDPLPGTVNYFLGNDPAQWHTNIPTYQRVRLHDVYPGVDLVYYGTHGQLEYDFVVAPGANPSPIALGFSGADRLGVDLLGNLSLSLPGGAIAQEKPLVYQTVNGVRQPITGGYTLATGGHVGFALGAYNPHLPLVIDPAYRFSTFLGGSDSDAFFGSHIALDASGNVYLTGSTYSTDFPTTVGAFQSHLATGASDNAFVSKLNANGTALLYSTYLGGGGMDEAFDIAVDSGGNAYITGSTSSTNFPTTPGAFQTTYSGNGDAFITKLNANGTALLYSTYLGGSIGESGSSIALDNAGNAYVTGETTSTDFPTTPSAFQTTSAGDDAFATKLNASGSALVYSTYLGGSNFNRGHGIAVDTGGAAYVTGETNSTDFPTTASAFQTSLAGNYDAFVSKLNASGSALVYSTYLGGSSGYETGNSIALDSGGNAYLTGSTGSTDFPTTSGAFQTTSAGDDAFATKLNASGSALVYSTYLGGGDNDAGNSIALDMSGDAYVTGYTDSTNFPLVTPLQGVLYSILRDGGFVSELNTSGSALLFSTYLGGSGGGDQAFGVAAMGSNTVYVSGYTASNDFPTSNALYPNYHGTGDAFITKIYTGPTPTTTGVFRPSNGALYLKNANTTGNADIALYYGQPGDQPVTGDWTRKGYKSIGIYRNGTFYLRNTNTTGYADIVVPFGASTDIPVAGDWTGKGYDSIGVYRPSNSTFYLRNSNTSGPPDLVATLGVKGDVPIVGDWNGDGVDSIGVFRPSNGIVYLRNTNSTGFADFNFVYGIAGDKPVVGDWDGNGTDTIGVDRAGNFLLRNSNSTGPANLSFYLGVNGDVPIAGPWQPPSGSAPPPTHQPSAPATHQASVPAATPTRRGRG